MGPAGVGEDYASLRRHYSLMTATIAEKRSERKDQLNGPVSLVCKKGENHLLIISMRISPPRLK